MPPADLPQIDTTKASIARVYDAMLDGKDNYQVDREIREQIVQFAPEIMTAATDGRGFLIRATRFLAGTIGIDQFLDVGSGLPTAENTHQAAQRVNKDAQVVYVDNDPVVLAHGRALLEENERTRFVAADLTKPEEVLSNPDVQRLIDFSRPLAFYQIGTLHHVGDDVKPAEIMAKYIEALPSGSYVALAHFCNPRDGSELSKVAQQIEDIITESSMGTGWFRTREQILGFFGDLELVEPGLVAVADWWPDGPRTKPLGYAQLAYVGAVGRKL